MSKNLFNLIVSDLKAAKKKRDPAARNYLEIFLLILDSTLHLFIDYVIFSGGLVKLLIRFLNSHREYLPPLKFTLQLKLILVFLLIMELAL